MRKIFINSGLILGLLVALSLNSCKDNINPIVTELQFSRAFTPLKLTAQISKVTTVTLSWSAVNNVDHYVVEIYTGTDPSTGTLVQSINVDGASTILVYVLPAGDTQFCAQLKAVSSLEGVGDSNWSIVTFKSLTENLFNGYITELSGIKTCIVRWLPGASVTDVVFNNGTTDISFPLNDSEKAAGVKTITVPTNGNYRISLMNTTFSRGKTSLSFEGDVYVASGSDLAAAITAAPAGSVILLQNSSTYAVAGNFLINKSIKIRGLSVNNRPTIYPATGASTTAPSFLIDPAVADSIVFQNLILTGNVNNVAGTMVTGVYDQGTSNACNIATLKFKSCILQHFGRHVIRLRGTASQIINSFEVDDCILNDFGTNTSSRGIICSNTVGGKINSIKFSNSTVYSFSSQFILYSNASACQGISISNCTFNQLCTDATAQYFIDLNATGSTANVYITNCLFGATSTAAAGIRPGTMVVNMNNCFYTSDYSDGPTYSVKSKMTTYNGASTALWTNPSGGVFTFLDKSFAGKSTAGDPRWW